MKIITVLFFYLLINNSYCATFEDAIAEGIKGNNYKAYSILMPLAEQGNADAQCLIGVMYNNGEGVETNKNEAFKWFKLAAEQGLSECQVELAFIYQSMGKKNEAFKWSLLAAKQNQVTAQRLVGTMYLEGRGIDKDEKEGFMWIKLASENQNKKTEYESLFFLGLLYAEGIGTEKNKIKAAEMFKKSIIFRKKYKKELNKIPEIEAKLAEIKKDLKKENKKTNIDENIQKFEKNSDPLNIRN